MFYLPGNTRAQDPLGKKTRDTCTCQTEDKKRVTNEPGPLARGEMTALTTRH